MKTRITLKRSNKKLKTNQYNCIQPNLLRKRKNEYDQQPSQLRFLEKIGGFLDRGVDM